jgi:hypothetical protein
VRSIPHRIEFTADVQFEEKALEYMKVAKAAAAADCLKELSAKNSIYILTAVLNSNWMQGSNLKWATDL